MRPDPYFLQILFSTFNLLHPGPYTPTKYRPVIKHVQVLKRTTKTTSVDIGTTISLRAGNSMIIKCPVSVYGGVRGCLNHLNGP